MLLTVIETDAILFLIGEGMLYAGGGAPIPAPAPAPPSISPGEVKVSLTVQVAYSILP